VATKPSAEPQSKIIDAAARVLRDHGPAAVTTRRVAEQAGVQPPAIYRLFGDKDGLLEAVAEQRDPDLARAMYDTNPHRRTRSSGRQTMATAVTFRAIAPELDMLSNAERQLLDDWLAWVVSAL
jgi:AcrR family transcriptional regulator